MRAAAILALCAFPAFANEAEELLLAETGDAEYGEYLASECTSCHQISGAMDGIPPIVGWDEIAFRLTMHHFRNKTREHQAMNVIAARLGDEEIAALSAYFATLNPEDDG
ncbi:MAG: hypothetical protein LJE62_01250 [Silicimonas sp.]|jgi:cytochrome c|nr:hypothetical protein [Silicimonas sp.]